MQSRDQPQGFWATVESLHCGVGLEGQWVLLALRRFGVLEFVILNENAGEVTFSEEPDPHRICAWKKYSEPMLAQEHGRER